MGVPRFIAAYRHRGEPDKTEHSRVIHPGDAPEWVSVIHRNGSISEVKISADNDEVNIGVATADGKELHMGRPW
jgi:hypothetical protein